MRVTHLAATGQLGGAERVLLECIRAVPGGVHSVVALGLGALSDAAGAMGARADVVMPPRELAGAGDAFGPAVMLKSALPILRSFPGFFGRFSGAVSSQAPDLIHSHGIKTHVLGALMAPRVPLVWHLHDYVGMRSVSSRLLRLLAGRCSLAIAVSESVARDARRVLPSSLRVVVIHNAVDVSTFVPEGRTVDLDALSGLPAAPHGIIRIGLPATFAKWKGHEVFLDVMARLDRPDVRGYVIGAPVYETQSSQWSLTELQALVRERGLEGRVGFAGSIDDMPSAYRALDIVVHASTRPEPFGLVIAEAMACGRAVVAAPDGGAGELFEDGVQALAARGGDRTALLSALEKLIDDEDRRRALGLDARAHAVRSFSPGRFSVDLRAALSPLSTETPALEFV